jgi:hypothetical protein
MLYYGLALRCLDDTLTCAAVIARCFGVFGGTAWTDAERTAAFDAGAEDDLLSAFMRYTRWSEGHVGTGAECPGHIGEAIGGTKWALRRALVSGGLISAHGGQRGGGGGRRNIPESAFTDVSAWSAMCVHAPLARTGGVFAGGPRATARLASIALAVSAAAGDASSQSAQPTCALRTVLLRRVQGPPATVTPTPNAAIDAIDHPTANSDASLPPRDDSNVFYRELEYLHTDNSSHGAGPVVQLRLRSPAAKVLAEGSPPTGSSGGAPRGQAAIAHDDAAAVAQFEAADEKRRAARSTRHSVCVAIAPTTGGGGNPIALTGNAWLLYFAAAPTALATSEDCPAVLLCGGRMPLVATEATTCAAAAKLHQLLWRALQFDPAALCFEVQAAEGAAAATRATFPDVPAWVADAILKLIAQPPRSMDESGQTIRHEPALSP